MWKFIFFLTLSATLIIKTELSPPPASDEGARSKFDYSHLEHFHFGYRLPIADALWVELLQGLTACDDQIEVKSQISCQPTQNSWAGFVIDGINQFDPQYILPYEIGGVMLSVVIKDTGSATHIFDKGVALFPDNEPLMMKAAYHSLYGEKRMPKAAFRYERTAELGGPPWTHALAVKLYAGEHMEDEARKIYDTFKDQNLPKGTLDSIKKDLGIPD